MIGLKAVGEEKGLRRRSVGDPLEKVRLRRSIGEDPTKKIRRRRSDQEDLS